jgi:hypothetical protein
MRPFDQAPEVTRRQRVVETIGLLAAPLVVWVAWNIARTPFGRAPAPTMALRAFGAAAMVTLAALCLWPLWQRLREARLWQRHRALVSRCPACGASGDGVAGCARCGFPSSHVTGWTLVAVDPVAAVFSVGGAAAMVALASMFLLALTSVAETAAKVASLAIGVLLAGLGLALLVGAGEILVGARRTPVRFTWRRTWQLDGVGAFTEAEVVVAADAPSASGTTHLTLPAATALGARAPADATPFERGLAALLHDWNRSGDAPLVLQRTTAWRWPTARRPPDATDGAYRAASPTDDDGVAREETEHWAVDLNQHGFSWLLEDRNLPAQRIVEGEEAEELAEAEWSVSCAAIARVIAADDALRAAVEALAPDAAPDDPGYAVALHAARSR